MLYTKDQLTKILREDEYVVTFTKVNGEVRSMPCTLNDTFLPEVPLVMAESKKKPNPDVINVWCTDKDAWRSFRVASVTDIKKVV